MTLKEILRAAQVTPVEVLDDAEVSSMTADSRTCRPGSLFVCFPQLNRESEGFIPDAARNGATAVAVHSVFGMKLAQQEGLAAVLIPHLQMSFQETIWRLCDVFYDHPTRAMKLVGVTGTNGKTTTACVIRDMFRAANKQAGYLGTLGFETPTISRELSNTTPFAVDLYGMLAEARDAGVEAMAIEVSSHALAQHRADGLEFDAVVFTNLTQDHLDFHGSMSAYAQAKWRLFSELPKYSDKPIRAAFNVGNETGKNWATHFEEIGNPIRFGTSLELGDLDLGLIPHKVELDRITATIGRHFEGTWEEIHDVLIPLGGNYNVENAASAAAGMLACGYSLLQITDLLAKVHPVPGRFEAVQNSRGISVLVDYAHTPDGIQKLLSPVKELATQRVITVFGCGGDRDKGKRPKMARAASLVSDLTVVTSDNPRTEDPESILNEIVTGIEPGRESVAIVDRGEAIAYALSQANPGDVVVVAGKGHENYQIIGHEKFAMDDRELIRMALQ